MDKGAIAAGAPATAAAGAALLARGGNAVDAAVGAAFASFVAEATIVNIGGSAVYIPAVHDWDYENDNSADSSRFDTLEHIGQVPAYIAKLDAVS